MLPAVRDQNRNTGDNDRVAMCKKLESQIV